MSSVHERDVMLEPMFNITIGGKLLPEDMLKFVSELSVEDVEDELPMALITVMDTQNKWMTANIIKKGSKIIIKGGHRKSNKLLFDGKITHVEADFPEDGTPTLVVGAIDKGIDLTKARKPRSWKKKRVSDIVNIMLKECGLSGSVTSTGAVQEHIQQEDETNLEFITKWRELLGWRFYRNKSGKYYFGPATQNEKTIDRISYRTEGMEIISFSPVFNDPPTDDENENADYDNDSGRKHFSKLKYSGK